MKKLTIKLAKVALMLALAITTININFVYMIFVDPPELQKEAIILGKF